MVERAADGCVLVAPPKKAVPGSPSRQAQLPIGSVPRTMRNTRCVKVVGSHQLRAGGNDMLRPNEPFPATRSDTRNSLHVPCSGRLHAPLLGLPGAMPYSCVQRWPSSSAFGLPHSTMSFGDASRLLGPNFSSSHFANSSSAFYCQIYLRDIFYFLFKFYLSINPFYN